MRRARCLSPRQPTLAVAAHDEHLGATTRHRAQLPGAASGAGERGLVSQSLGEARATRRLSRFRAQASSRLRRKTALRQSPGRERVRANRDDNVVAPRSTSALVPSLSRAAQVELGGVGSGSRRSGAQPEEGLGAARVRWRGNSGRRRRRMVRLLDHTGGRDSVANRRSRGREGSRKRWTGTSSRTALSR